MSPNREPEMYCAFTSIYIPILEAKIILKIKWNKNTSLHAEAGFLSIYTQTSQVSHGTDKNVLLNPCGKLPA